MKMSWKTMLAGVLLTLTSCGGGKDSICDCLEAGNRLNQKGNAILENGSSEADAQELKALKKEKAQKCAEFQEMDGEEMRKRMADCAE